VTKYRTQKLKGKIHVKHGFPFKSEHFAEKGDFVVVTPGNFYEGGGFKRNAEKDKCYTHGFPKEYLLRKNDLVVAMTEQAEGLLGSTAKIPCDGKFLHNQRIGLITATSREIDLDFIYHLFKINFVRRQIKGSASGTKVKHTSPERISDVLAPIPDKITQSRIAAVLSTLDAKIEINHRLNEELEGLAKLLYDYWFVQFDFPISADQAAAMGAPKLEGKPYRQSGGKMTYNPTLNREIPLGWRSGTLSDIAEIIMGQSPPGESYNSSGEGVLFFQGSTDFGWRFPTARQYTTQPTRYAKAGDILLSVRAPVGTMNIAPQDCAIGRGIAALRSKSNHDTYLWSVMFYFKQIFDRKNNDGTTFGSINKDDLYSLQVAIPAPEIVEDFEEKVRAGNTLIATNQKKSQELTALRDWLLPMLMNGQVSVGK
jgi:type I restriction enzyme S subunit